MYRESTRQVRIATAVLGLAFLACCLLGPAPIRAQEEVPEAPPATPESALERWGKDPERLEAELQGVLARARAAVEESKASLSAADLQEARIWEREIRSLDVALAEEEEELLAERVAQVRAEVQGRSAAAEADKWKARLPGIENETGAFLADLGSRRPEEAELEAAQADREAAIESEGAARSALVQTEARILGLDGSAERAQKLLAEREDEERERAQGLARLEEEGADEEELEAARARQPVLERQVRLAHERVAFLERVADFLAREREMRRQVAANALAVLEMAERKRSALLVASKGADAALALARDEAREEIQELERAIECETAANGKLRALADQIESRLAKWKAESETFRSTVAAPGEARMERDVAAGTEGRLVDAQADEQLVDFEKQVGELEVRLATLEEEITNLRTERETRVPEVEAALVTLQKQVEETRAAAAAARESAADPIRVQQLQESTARLEELVQERAELVDRVKRGYDGLVAEVEALRGILAEHLAVAAGSRDELSEAMDRGWTRFLGRTLPISPWIGIPSICLLLAGLTLAVGFGLTRFLKRRIAASGSVHTKVFLRIFQTYMPGLLAIASLYVLVNSGWFSEDLAQGLETWLYVVLIAIATAVLMKGTLLLFQRRVSSGSSLQGPARSVIRIAFATTGILIILDALSVTITPLLTGLGIGSLAVALALQDTLSNFFAGLYMTADRPIRVGDYIRMDTGDEGYVEEVSWRSTRLKTLSNNIVIVPNQRLAQCVITNFNLPEPSIGVSTIVSVSSREDSSRVEAILCDEMKKAAGQVDGLFRDPGPKVQIAPTFGPRSLDFTIGCRARDYESKSTVLHELRKRIHERLRCEGVELPDASARRLPEAAGRAG